MPYTLPTHFCGGGKESKEKERRGVEQAEQSKGKDKEDEWEK